MKPSAVDILLGRYKTPEELKLEREIAELPDGAKAQQADRDRAVVLLQQLADSRRAPSQDLIEKFAGYLNPDRAGVPRKPVAKAANAGAAMRTRELARKLDINPNSLTGFIEATRLEAEYRNSDLHSEPSISKLARVAGVSRSTVRRWRGDDPKEDEPRRRRRWGVWLYCVGLGMNDPQELLKII